MLNIEIRSFRAIERADIILSPIALCAALNGAGKTSIVQAVRAALRNDHLPLDGSTKKASDVYVRRGSEAASVTASHEGGSITLTWPKNKATIEGNAPKASAFAVGEKSLLDLKDKERASALAPYVKSEVKVEDLNAALTDAGFNEKACANVWAAVTDKTKGWDDSHGKALALRTKLKADWENTTGENYGSEKAAVWKPADWDAEIAETSVEMLTDNVTASQQAVEKMIGRAAVSAAEVDALKAQAAEPKPSLELLTASKSALQVEMDRAKKERAELAPTDAENATPCPCCNELLIVDSPWKGKFVLKQAPKKKGSAEQIKKANMKIAELDGAIAKLAGDMMAKDSAISDAQYKIRRITEAETRLKGIEATGTVDETAVSQARASLAADQSRLKMKTDKDKADQVHAGILRNEKLIGILAPDGIRKKALTQALTGFNDNLDTLCAFAGWASVRIDENLDFFYGAEAYWLASESQQFRVRTILQVAQAQLDGSAAVLIDRADMLDSVGRNGLFGLLKAAGVPALVACTMNKPGVVPDLAKAGMGQSLWIEGGKAVAIGDLNQERAA